MRDYKSELFKETYGEILDKLKEEDKNHKYLTVLKDIWELKLRGKRMQAYLKGLSISGDFKLYGYYRHHIYYVFRDIKNPKCLIINLYSELKKDGIIK